LRLLGSPPSPSTSTSHRMRSSPNIRCYHLISAKHLQKTWQPVWPGSWNDQSLANDHYVITASPHRRRSPLSIKGFPLQSAAFSLHWFLVSSLLKSLRVNNLRILSQNPFLVSGLPPLNRTESSPFLLVCSDGPQTPTLPQLCGCCPRPRYG
jgi:hypothetical protein